MVINILLSFLFLVLVLSITHASNECPPARCDKDGPIIQFPFWLQQQQQNCKPSGFNLSCNGSSKYPILHIPGSGDFYLTSVYYSIRIVTLQDVEGCLLKRLMSLDLSSTPFLAMMYRNYTLFTCPKGQPDTTKVIECASNDESDVYAKTNVAVGPYGCSKIATVPVPVSSYYPNYVFFPDDLELTWDVREPPSGKDNLSEFGSSALIFTIPIVFLLIMIVGFICMKKRRNQHHATTSSIQFSEAGGITSRGLDKSIIEAYTKITIQERLVEGPNGVTCTICLADYAINDTIRFMPTCEHYFHVECIDKWLSMNRKCPICRIQLPNI